MRIFLPLTFFLFFIFPLHAVNVLRPLVLFPLGSSAEELMTHARSHQWQMSSLDQSQLWQRAETQAFLQFRAQMGAENLQVYAYRVKWFDQDVEMFFFFNKNRLFAVNLSIESLLEQEFISLIQEMGGPRKDGYLGYGAPIWQDGRKEFLVYMWYLNPTFTHTLIMTYFGKNVNPMFTLQIVDENLGN